MNSIIKRLATLITRWAASKLNDRPRGTPIRVIGDHHIKWLRGETVYIVGRSDDNLLVRCWLPNIQLEVNLNPACLE